MTMTRLLDIESCRLVVEWLDSWSSSKSHLTLWRSTIEEEKWEGIVAGLTFFGSPTEPWEEVVMTGPEIDHHRIVVVSDNIFGTVINRRFEEMHSFFFLS